MIEFMAIGPRQAHTRPDDRFREPAPQPSSRTKDTLINTAETALGTSLNQSNTGLSGH